MTRNRFPAVKTAASIAFCALVALTVSISPASADEHRDGHRGDRHDWGRHHDDRGRYYPPPPVVYGGPYYAPPPVVYGPAIGIALPGIVIGIH